LTDAENVIYWAKQLNM